MPMFRARHGVGRYAHHVLLGIYLFGWGHNPLAAFPMTLATAVPNSSPAPTSAARTLPAPPAGWIVEVLPGLVSIPVVQGALVVAMLGLVAVMAVRWTVGVVAAAAVITVLGGWLVLAPVFTRFDGPWVVALGAVLVMAAATAAVSGSEDPRPRLLTRLSP